MLVLDVVAPSTDAGPMDPRGVIGLASRPDDEKAGPFKRETEWIKVVRVLYMGCTWPR